MQFVQKCKTMILNCFLINQVNCYNILGVFPFMGKSHFYVYDVYLKELARRGHNLTVISYFPQKQPLENYHDIDLGKGKSLFELNHPVSVSYAQALLSFAILQPIVGSYTCRQILDDEEVQDMILTQRKFDLVVAEQFNTDCPLAIAHLLDAPVVGITSYMLLPWHYPRYGVPYNPSYILYDVYHGGTKPTFLQRIVRSFSYQFINFLQKHICKHEDSVISHYYDNVPSVEELGRQVKFLLLYQNLVLAGSQILPPNVVEVGGYHIAQPKQLPADLQNFIDESKNGVIYISFGTILQGSSIKKEYFRAILDVVSELPQRVVWKWDKKLPQNIINIYSSKWLPQNDILSHPNVVAFFSHCGMLGTTEAIHHGVPVLGMPVIGDQFTNAAAIEEQGLGVQISYNSISKELLLEKFKIQVFAIAFRHCITLNIVAILPFHGRSHFIVQRVYLNELLRRGHNLTVISHFPEKSPPSNYYDVSLAENSTVFENSLLYRQSYVKFPLVSFNMLKYGRESCEVLLSNQNVQQLIRQKPKYDLAIVDQFNTDCGLGLAYKFNAPIVGISANGIMPWLYERFGVPYHPAYVPFQFVGGGRHPTVLQRFERSILNTYTKFIFYFSQKLEQLKVAKYLGDVPPLEEIAKDIKLLLVYNNFVLTGSDIYPSNIISVSGYHVPEAKEVTGDLKSFIEGATHGVIYISFGSLVKTSSLPDNIVTAIIHAISAMPQRFIWKWHNKSQVLDKNKVFIADWLPQIDILAFFSHGGLNGAVEALHYSVPILAFPILGDQPSNAASIEESGLGVQIQGHEITNETLVAALKKILDPQFRENVTRLSRAWHDRPISALNTAIYWTEFVARHPHLNYRNRVVDIPFYQYWCLDILCIYIAIILTFVCLLKIALKMYRIKHIVQDKKHTMKRSKQE
ncbi:unnamed protein product [Leptidea sinapis]|uniref:Uncharacterized protein n=1 Tax=Leptidea sinapis TaxID=189913 RepID=A0A5E4QYU8_9NEOP|nr:unnamed protein product [Leptidea sinapis]